MLGKIRPFNRMFNVDDFDENVDFSFDVCYVKPTCHKAIFISF